MTDRELKDFLRHLNNLHNEILSGDPKRMHAADLQIHKISGKILAIIEDIPDNPFTEEIKYVYGQLQ